MSKSNHSLPCVIYSNFYCPNNYIGVKVISFVIPSYNERDSIPKQIRHIEKVLVSNKLKGEIIIVDDNSPDGTIDVVRKLQENSKISDYSFEKRRRSRLGISYGIQEGKGGRYHRN